MSLRKVDSCGLSLPEGLCQSAVFEWTAGSERIRWIEFSIEGPQISKPLNVYAVSQPKRQHSTGRMLASLSWSGQFGQGLLG